MDRHSRLAALVSLLVLVTACMPARRDDGPRDDVSAGRLVLPNGDALDVGAVAVGATGSARLRLLNEGGRPIQIDSVQLDPDTPPGFSVSIDAKELLAGQWRELVVRYTPSDVGAVTGSITIVASDKDEPVRVSLSAQGVRPVLSVSTASLHVGTAVVGELVTGAFQVSNPGPASAPLRIEGPGSPFTLAAAPHALIPAGESVSVTIAFIPAEVGTASSSLTVRGCATCEPVSVGLTGRGIPAALVVDPESLDFGASPIDAVATRTLTFVNRSPRRAAIVTLQVEPPSSHFSVPFPGAWPVIAPGQSAAVTVHFNPTAVGRKQAHIVATTDDPERPRIEVPLTGYAGGPVLEVSPPSVDFGDAATGHPVSTRVVISNHGPNDPSSTEDDLVITSLSVTNESVFAAVPVSPLPWRIPAGGSALVDVRYLPSQPGSHTARLVVGRDGQTLAEIPLQGRARTTPACSYTLEPQTVDFGTVIAGDAADRQVVLRNTGGAECIVTSAALRTGETSPSMRMADGALLGRLVPAGGTLSIPLRFEPAAETSALHSGVLDVAVAQGTPPTRSVTLTGRKGLRCLSIEPQSVDFGQATVSCAEPERVLTVRNTCAGTVTMESVRLEPSLPAFRITAPATPFTLSGGSSGELRVVFSPQSTGAFDATLLLSARDSEGISVVHPVPLHGEGILSGALREETFTQAGHRKLDLLIVMDDSGSMAENQQDFAMEFAALTEFATQRGVDWRIAVTTTDTDACTTAGPNGRFVPLGGVPKVLTPNTPDLARTFATNVTPGTSGCGTEEGLEAAVRALTPPRSTSDNVGFLRSDAALSVLIVSDENDYSGTEPMLPPPFGSRTLGSVPSYVASLQELKGASRLNDVALHAFVGRDGETCPVVVEPGRRYVDAATRTGGHVESLCGQSWTEAVRRLGRHAFGLRSSFLLAAAPATGSVRVHVDGVERAGWALQVNPPAIAFDAHAVPAAGAQVRVTYSAACQ